MQKTKLGISVGILGAIVYFTAIFGGYIPLFIVAGYIFIREENAWLRKAAFKAVALMLIFSGLSVAIQCINDVLSVFNRLFDLTLAIPLNLDYVLGTILSLAKIVLCAVLGFKAFSQGDVAIPTIDAAMDEKNN